MTSQPDSKDGPPHDTALRRRLLDLLVYCAEQGKVANGTTGAMDLLDSYDATVLRLRVVPPEGADNAVHLTVAWNAFSRAWSYETTPTLRDALFVAVEAALESAALRASGAGTRQEEPNE